MNEIEGSRRRGRPVVRGKDRVKEYMHVLIEAEALNKQGESIWIWKGVGSFTVALPLRDISRENEASEKL